MKKSFVPSLVIAGLLLCLNAAITPLAHADLINGTTDCPDNLVCNTTIETPEDAITAVIEIVLGVAGALAVLFVIIGGFRYITAQGDEKKVEGAKATLKNAIIGLVVILLAFAILSAVESFVISTVE